MNRKAVSLVMAASLVLSGAAALPTTALAAETVTVSISSSKDDVTVGDSLDFTVKTTGIDAATKVLYDWTATGFDLAENSKWDKTTINAAAKDASASKEKEDQKTVTCTVYEDTDADGKLDTAKDTKLGERYLGLFVKNKAVDAGLDAATVTSLATGISMNETVILTAVFDKEAVKSDTAVTLDQDLVTGDPMKVTYALKDATTDGAIIDLVPDNGGGKAKVTGKKPGDATIVMKYGDAAEHTYAVKVTDTAGVTAVNLTPANLNLVYNPDLALQQSYDVAVSWTPTTGTAYDEKNIVWTFYNVSETGVESAVEVKGTLAAAKTEQIEDKKQSTKYEVTVSKDLKTATFKAASGTKNTTTAMTYTVAMGNTKTEAKVEIGTKAVATEIKLSDTAVSLSAGTTKTLTVVPTPAEATPVITWTSDNTQVVTVANGVLTAVAEGTATVTATTDNNLKATCAVTVTKAEPVLPEVGKTITDELGSEYTVLSDQTLCLDKLASGVDEISNVIFTFGGTRYEYKVVAIDTKALQGYKNKKLYISAPVMGINKKAFKGAAVKNIIFGQADALEVVDKKAFKGNKNSVKAKADGAKFSKDAAAQLKKAGATVPSKSISK